MNDQVPEKKDERPKLPVRVDPFLKKREMDHQIIGQFLGDERQNTEITASQRMLISAAHLVSEGDSWKVSKGLSTNPDESFWKTPQIDVFVEQFLYNGISVGRKGRTEAEHVAVAMFEADKAIAQAEAQRSKLLQ